MRTLTILLVLAGCAAVPPSSDNGGEARLARELTGRSAGESEACVPIIQSRSLEVVNDRTLVYRTGDTVWVNRLEAACPGLDTWSTLIVEPFSGRYCRNDRVRALEAGAIIPGPPCPLSEWVPYRRPD